MINFVKSFVLLRNFLFIFYMYIDGLHRGNWKAKKNVWAIQVANRTIRNRQMQRKIRKIPSDCILIGAGMTESLATRYHWPFQTTTFMCVPAFASAFSCEIALSIFGQSCLCVTCNLFTLTAFIDSCSNCYSISSCVHIPPFVWKGMEQKMSSFHLSTFQCKINL